MAFLFVGHPAVWSQPPQQPDQRPHLHDAHHKVRRGVPLCRRSRQAAAEPGRTTAGRSTGIGCQRHTQGTLHVRTSCIHTNCTSTLYSQPSPSACSNQFHRSPLFIESAITLHFLTSLFPALQSYDVDNKWGCSALDRVYNDMASQQGSSPMPGVTIPDASWHSAEALRQALAGNDVLKTIEFFRHMRKVLSAVGLGSVEMAA